MTYPPSIVMSLQRGSVSLAHNFREKGSPPPTILPVNKLGSFMWYNNVDTTSFRTVTNHAFDIQTGAQTDSFFRGQTEIHAMHAAR